MPKKPKAQGFTDAQARTIIFLSARAHACGLSLDLQDKTPKLWRWKLTNNSGRFVYGCTSLLVLGIYLEGYEDARQAFEKAQPKP